MKPFIQNDKIFGKVLYLPLDNNLQMELVKALRYGMGRYTCAASNSIELVTTLIPYLSDNVMGIIRQDITDELAMYQRMNKELTDADLWRKLHAKLKAEQERRKHHGRSGGND